MKTAVSNEFILEAHKSACNEWKLKIEKECHELFESKSGWYKDKNKENKDWLFYKNFVNNRMYGFDACGDWVFKEIVLKVDYANEYLATEEEVKEALVKEAKKRGFKKGVIIDKLLGCNVGSLSIENEKQLETNNFTTNPDLQFLYSNNLVIFRNGKWAEIISNPIEEKINDLQKQLDELKKQL